MARSSTRPSVPSVRFVTQGTYQTELSQVDDVDLVAGTETTIAVVNGNIKADTADKDEMFSWVRYKGVLAKTSATVVFEWMLMKLKTVDGTPDLNDSDVVEALQKESRIFTRGFICQPGTLYARPEYIKFEVFNVLLPYGEELRLVVRPLGTVSDCFTSGVLEWRRLGA